MPSPVSNLELTSTQDCEVTGPAAKPHVKEETVVEEKTQKGQDRILCGISDSLDLPVCTKSMIQRFYAIQKRAQKRAQMAQVGTLETEGQPTVTKTVQDQNATNGDKPEKSPAHNVFNNVAEDWPSPKTQKGLKQMSSQKPPAELPKFVEKDEDCEMETKRDLCDAAFKPTEIPKPDFHRFLNCSQLICTSGIRGQPKEIQSDNGTNLKRAEKELDQALDEVVKPHVDAKLNEERTGWHFVPPSAPHTGGSWERLVRSNLKSGTPRKETRQLTDIPLDPPSPEALTHMHFLIGTSSALQSPSEFDDRDEQLFKKWRSSQRLVDRFWKRWVKKNPLTLQRRAKGHGVAVPVTVGDMVGGLHEPLKREVWLPGVLVAVYPRKETGMRTAMDVWNWKSRLYAPVLDFGSKSGGSMLRRI